MAELATVVNIQDYRRTGSDSARIIEASVSPARSAPKSGAEPDDLYPSDSPAGQVLRLLSEGERYVGSALTLFAAKDLVGADNEISLFQANLPELFYFHEMSQAFAAVVVALHHALRNRNGEPLTQEQLYEVHEAVSALHRNPFMKFDTALDLIDTLNGAGLITDPSDLEALGDVLTSEGFP